jgi:hypothetical protein
MRPRALTGQRDWLSVGHWPTFSPLTAFFWSENLRLVVFGEGKSVFVMQRSVKGNIDSSVYCEGNIAETKGLAAGFSGGGVKVFSGAEQPEESKDDELDGVLLDVPKDRVIDIEHREELLDDGDIDTLVGSGCRVVFPLHGSVEIREYGMELSCFRVDWRIWAVQVSEPLGIGGDSVRNCARSDRLTLLAFFAVSESERHQDVAENVFGNGQKSVQMPKILLEAFWRLVVVAAEAIPSAVQRSAAKRFLVGVAAVAMV